MSFRTYHQVEGQDASRLADQVGAQRRRVQDRLRAVRRVIGVMSGKGGVGKSYVTAGLAVGAAGGGRLGGGVGVLDADLKGPTTARMLGASGPLRVDGEGVHPAQGRDGIKVFSMDLLLEDGQPLRWREPAHEGFVWRGVLEVGALREFLADVVWGPLDLLLVDLPPEVDALEHLAELVPGLAGAVAVTIPSDESRRSVARAMRAAAGTGVRLLGVIENMSGYACPACGGTGPLFPGNAGEELAAEFDTPLLARLPFHPAAGAPTPPPLTLTDALLAGLP